MKIVEDTRAFMMFVSYVVLFLHHCTSLTLSKPELCEMDIELLVSEVGKCQCYGMFLNKNIKIKQTIILS